MQSKTATEIKSAVQKMLDEGRHDPYLHVSDGNAVGVGDLAVVICYYGTDSARLDATLKSFRLFSEYKARPSEILVVEAQYGEADARLEKAAGDAGFSYAFVRRDPDDAGIYIKEALMNVGVRRVSAPKIVVLDSDIGFCNPYWARNVSALLDECDMTQPFGMVYFTKNGEYEPQRAGLEPAMTRTYSRTNDKRMLNNTGLGFAFRRWVFDAIGGFDVIASPSDDMWLWSKLFEIDGSRISLFPYAKSVDGCSNRQCTKAQLKACSEICFHIEHGDLATRRYAAYVYTCMRHSVYPAWDVDYDSRSDAMPRWNAADEPWISLRRRACAQIAALPAEAVADSPSARKAAKAVIDSVNFQAFGAPKSRPRVVTALTCCNRADDVVLHKKLVEDAFGGGVDYLCVSDVDIPGVDTVRPQTRNRLMSAVEAFRPDVSGGGICLYMSLGAIPVEKIQLCDVPDGFVGFSNPRYSGATASAWRLYNKDVFLFSGDFGFVYEGYAGEGPFRQSAAFVDPCQCAAYNLYRRGVVIRNVCQFLDVQYVQYGKPSSYAEYAENVVGLVQRNKFSNAQIVVGNQFGRLAFK